jgi:hypothetical protein
MAAHGYFGLSDESMVAEAHQIIDAARDKGTALRLVGGLAVREHCHATRFCERSYRDIDLVGLSRSAKAAAIVLGDLGWDENRQVNMATMGRKRQFFRPCRHAVGSGRVHEDDRVDLYLDAFRLHHTIDLRSRLELEPYTVSTSDALLVKLQRVRLDDDDLRDAVSILDDAATIGFDDAPDGINVRYVASLCARDWGLHHDVALNLARCRLALDSLGLGREGHVRVRQRLEMLEQALAEAPKTRRWRLRARVGERLAWHEPVDDVEGVYFSLGERIQRP